MWILLCWMRWISKNTSKTGLRHRPLPKRCRAQREQLLEVKHLSFGYTKGQQTLRNVSLSIDKGEMVSIVGRNGAGKSTFSKLICGFEDAGFRGNYLPAVKIFLKENIRHRAKYIGYVMQNPNQMISKTMIFDEVALSLQKGRDGLKAEVRREGGRYTENLRTLSVP